MKRKIVIVIFIVMLLSGCSINYNLDINDNEIIETTTMTQETSDTYSNDYLMNSYNQEYPIFIDEEFMYYAPTEKKEGNTYYEKSIDNNGTYTANYIAKFNLDNYYRSRTLDTAYKYHMIGYNNNEKCYYITANDLKILNNNKNINNITVTINLNDYEVVESNHHNKEGNKYIWTFDRNSKGTINIKFKKENSNTLPTAPSSSHSQTETSENKRDYTMYIFSGILLVVFLIGYGIFKKITNKDDSIE